MEKLFQVPSERAQSPRGERQKEGERINREKLLSHAARGRVFVRRACRGGAWRDHTGPPPPLLPLGYLFSPICQKGDAAGGRDAQEHGPAERDPHPAMGGQDGPRGRRSAGAPPK